MRTTYDCLSLVKMAVGGVALGITMASAALKVGDKAPSLESAKWVRGDVVKTFDGDHVYIVEFWASWCGPCVQAIPHLSSLQTKFKERGLAVIGQNLDEDEATIKPFLGKMGKKMNYAVTCDDGSGRMGKQWLKAAGQSGIPCGFVIDKSGKIAYIGHPMSLPEELLEKLLSAPSTKPKATSAAPAVAEKPSPAAQGLLNQIQSAHAAGNFDEAEKLTSQLHQLLPDSLRHMAGKWDMELLLARGKHQEASELGKVMAEDFSAQPIVVFNIVGQMISCQSPHASLLESADKILAPMVLTPSPMQAAALSIAARVAHLRGDGAKAAELQGNAVELLPEGLKKDAQALQSIYQNSSAPAAGNP